MSSVVDRLRRSLVSDMKAPLVWSTAAFALAGMLIAALVAVAVGLGDVSLPAGFVVTLAGVASGLVPPGLTRQVAVPAGRLVGALGSTTYVLAVGMALVRDVPAVTHVLGRGDRAGHRGGDHLGCACHAQIRWGHAAATPETPRLPGWFLSRLGFGIVAALRDWREDAYVRLGLRGIVVLAPLVVVLEARRVPVSLYAFIVAFSITQPTASDTLNRALAVGAAVGLLATVVIPVPRPTASPSGDSS